MSLNISLYTISAALILDNEGNRLYAKYYQNKSPKEVSKSGPTPLPDVHFQSLAQQLKFEKSVFSKINKVHQDILLYDNHLVTYRQRNDVVLIIVAKINENESLIYSLMSNLWDALSTLLDMTVDKSTVLDKYDMVSLAIDETIDDGIIIEMDSDIIISRVTNPPKNEANINIELNERSIFNALSFASRKIGEKLQQGL